MAQPRRLIGLVVVILVVLVAAELAVRLRSDVLAPHQVWFGPEMQFKSAQVAHLEDHGGASLVFLGSSSLDAAANPRFFTRTPTARPVYNASTGAGTLAMIDAWGRLFALPKLHPDVVVIGLTGRELNPNNPRGQDLEHNFALSPAVQHIEGTEDVLTAAERHVEDWSYLFRYRTDLRQPTYMAKMVGLGNAAGPDAYAVRVAPDGHYLGFQDVSYTVNAKTPALFAAQGFGNFTIGATQLATLRRLVAAAQSAGAKVVILDMPVSPDLISYYPQQQRTSEQVRAALAGVAAKTGADFLAPGVWPTKDFADPAHVNRIGSARLSRYLAARLDALGLTSSP